MQQSDNIFLQYIDTIQASQKRINLKSMYKWISKYEKERGLVIADFTASDIVNMLNQQLRLSVAAARSWIDALNGFYKWLQCQGKLIANPICDVTYHDLDFANAIRCCCYQDHHDIVSLLKRKWNFNEGKAVYPITVFAWMGIPMADAASIMPQDVDLARGTIHHDSQNAYCILTSEMKDILRQYTEFQSSTRDNDITMVRDYSCKTFLYRLDLQNAKEQAQPGRTVDISAELGDASRILRKSQICDGLSYAEIVKSGVLRRMYAMECLQEDPEQIIQYGSRVFQTSKGYPGDTQIIYETYKKVFGLG